MFVEFDAAGEHSTKIKNCGITYTAVNLQQVVGTNTSGCSEANEACAQISRILRGYQKDALRDAQNIQVLAMNFEEIDKEAANKMRLL